MNETIYYCVLKNYKGVFRKKFRGNTHLFFIPLDDKLYGYFSLIGKMIDAPDDFPPGFDRYACKLIVKLPKEIVQTVIDHQIEYFKGRYQVVEQVQCNPKKTGIGQYFIDTNKGNFIKSDLLLKYQVEYSTASKRIYTIDGALDFLSTEISKTKGISSDLMRQNAILSAITASTKFRENVDTHLLAECSRIAIKEKAMNRYSISKFSKICEHLDKQSDEKILEKLFGKEFITEQRSSVEPYDKTAIKYGAAGIGGSGVAAGTGLIIRRLGRVGVNPYGPAAAVLGAGIATTALYLYRRLTDPCREKASKFEGKKKKLAYHQCKAEASKKVINRLIDGMSDCRLARDPQKCLEKMQKNIDKWKQVYQDQIVKAKRSVYSED